MADRSIEKKWLACGENAECTSVLGGCSYWQPVNKKYVKTIEAAIFEPCKKTSDPGPQPQSSCVDHLCVNSSASSSRTPAKPLRGGLPNCSDIKGPEHGCCVALLQEMSHDPSLRIPPLATDHPDAVGAGTDCPRGYQPSPTTCNGHAAWCEEKLYGTDRTSAEEKDRCEKEGGRPCIFDLCQTMMGDGNAPRCSPGWKISY